MKLFDILIFCVVAAVLISCEGDEPEPQCEELPTASVLSTSVTSTCTSADGGVVVSGEGEEPLEFSIDDGTSFQTSGEFSRLKAGVYNIVVRDAKGCSSETIKANVEAGGTDLSNSIATTADTECFENNGIIEIKATGGEPPYQYSIGGEFVTDEVFGSLSPGDYEVKTKDAVGCVISTLVSIERGNTGTSYQSDIKSIILSSCAISGCHNGDNGANLDYTKFNLLQSKADLVKQRTQSGSMPQTGSITEEEKALIACWVDEGAKNN